MKQYKFALDTGKEIIRIGDNVEYLIKGEAKPRNAQLVGLFTSVHPPHDVGVMFSDRPYYNSVMESDINYIKKEAAHDTDNDA
jgi:hypothetical protein